MNKIYIVGLGPGDEDQMTYEAAKALEEADLLCGYTVYIDLVKHLYPRKETFTTPMRQELERCRWALEQAEKGKTVALVCSGDAGVYGMASPLLELAEDFPEVEIQVIAGVTAALSGSAVLGAPLAHDFCVISLSDLLTPWEVIENRIRCAGQADFAIAIYNPSSKKRHDYLQRCVDLLLESGKTADTLCGYVKNIGRAGQESRILTLAQLREETLDMFTTVFIGNSETRRMRDWLITPRGYHRK